MPSLILTLLSLERKSFLFSYCCFWLSWQGTMRPVRRLVVIKSYQNYDRSKCLGIDWCCLKEGRVVEVGLTTQKSVWSKIYRNMYSSPISSYWFLLYFSVSNYILCLSRRFCQLSQKMEVSTLYITLKQSCRMARGHLNPQGRGKIYRGNYTFGTLKMNFLLI